MLYISVFRAIDDIDSCKRFAEGHANVLTDYGVTKVTSAKVDWFYNPSVFVVLVENEDKVVVGGERIHIDHTGYELPIESAVSVVEKGIYDLVKRYSTPKITGELCGLWNAKSIAGKGVSVLLTKMGVAVARMLRMNSLFVLCAPYTVEMCQKAGFEIETSLGNQGQFVYPKLDLIATSLVIKDVVNIPKADENFKKEIFYYYNNPKSTTIEYGQKGNAEVQYDILIPNF